MSALIPAINFTQYSLKQQPNPHNEQNTSYDPAECPFRQGDEYTVPEENAEENAGNGKKNLNVNTQLVPLKSIILMISPKPRG